MSTYLLDVVAAVNWASVALVARSEGTGAGDSEGSERGNGDETNEHYDG